MAYSSFLRELRDSDGDLISENNVTATIQSETLNVSEFDEIGIAVDTGTCTGTSTTLDITPQWSPDGGTTWYTSWPIATGEVDGTAVGEAALDTLTDSSDDEFHQAWWPNWAVTGARLRFNFAVAGTTPVFPIKVYVMGRNRVRGKI